jgi:uncharacterized protein YjiS (DUF1127 family)
MELIMAYPLSVALGRPARRHLPLLRLLQRIMILRHERRALARLDDHLLADIGLTPDAARIESERPLWDAPAHWYHPDRAIR